ncbi:HD domain-containing protein [Spirosoma fluminis]
MQTQLACQFMLDTLTAHLSPLLTYHSVHHTQDVMKQADRIARAEGITDPDLLHLLQTAACYHDAGFLNVYAEHEAESCRLATLHLPTFDYAPAQVAQVCQLIRSTRLPQAPSTFPESILCDADLDYLGRDDYAPISHSLLSEWLAYDCLADPADWVSIQRSFLGSHRYFTATNKRLREAGKQRTLATL